MKLKKLIGLTGYKGAGKDEAGRELIAHGFHVVKFAGALKGMLQFYLQYVGLDPQTIFEMLEGGLKEVPSAFFGGKTTRYAMQTLGTEWGRHLIYTRLWVNACLDRCKQYDQVVVTDVRFHNEVEAIKGFGGTVIKIVRPGLSAEAHPSEAVIDELEVNFTIENNSTIPHLHEEVRNLLQRIQS